MNRYKITHIGEDILYVDGPSAAGTENTYVNAKDSGAVVAHPSWYRIVGGVVELRSNWQDIKDAEVIARAVKDARKSAITAAQTASGIRDITVEQAEAYIEGRLDTTDLDATGAAINQATNLAEAKSAIIASLIELRNLHRNTEEVLKKMVPYLLD